GRDIYIAEGCYNCHSQMIRPILAETMRYGDYSKPGEFVYDHPFQWGSRRIGPDLAREGGKQSNLWHIRHFENPGEMIENSVMPPYPWLLEKPLDFASIPVRVKAMTALGVPYDEQTVADAGQLAREQARLIAEDIKQQSGGADPRLAPLAEGTTIDVDEPLEETRVIALIAYLQRLGVDIYKTPEPAAGTEAEPSEAGGE
ncbi:MAG: cbb3-type cytochrome c oxidase subunit II, partial [Planctomycetota bacterium]